MILVTAAVAWEVVGFVGQGLFTARFLVQWLASEKKGESVVPVSFWWLSVTGSAVLALYAAVLRDPVFLLGSLVNGFLYARNLTLIHLRGRKPASTRVLAPTALAVLAFLLFLNLRGLDPTIPAFWLVLGFAGAALWTGRFVVQWYASERAGRSVMPRSFWYVGIAGSVTLLAYSVYRQKPVFILGCLFPPVPYLRNLALIYRKEGAPWLVRRAGEVWADARRRRIAVAAAGLLLAAFFAARALSHDSPPGPFLRYHSAARLVLDGRGADLYGPGSEFRDPPGLAALLVPLGALPVRTAEVVWVWAGLAAFLGLLAVCRRFTRRYGAAAGFSWVTFLLVIRFGWDSLALGEIHPLTVLAATAGIWLVETGRPARGGILVALAAVAKVWPLTLLAIFLVRGRRRALGAAAATLVVAGVLLPALAVGPRPALDLVRAHAARQVGAVGSGAPAEVPGESLKAMAFRLLGPVPFVRRDRSIDLSLHLLDAGGARALYAVLAAALLLALLLAARRARSPAAAPLLAGTAIAAAVLLSPEAKEEEFLALALLAAALVGRLSGADRPPTRTAWLLALAVAGAFLLGAIPSRGIVGREAAILFEAGCAAGFAALLLVAAAPLAAPRDGPGETVFETERLRVRPARPADAPLYFELWTDPRIMRNVGFPKGLDVTVPGIAADIRGRPESVFERLLVVERKEDGEAIGETKLHPPDADGVARTDVKLLPRHQRLGYGTETKNGLLDWLFTHTDCREVEGTPNVENAASIRMQEAVGGVRVAERTGVVHHYVYRVTRAVWEERRALRTGP